MCSYLNSTFIANNADLFYLGKGLSDEILLYVAVIQGRFVNGSNFVLKYRDLFKSSPKG